ncbi:TlpA disulfide reductase family protein [Zunongwangia atlantica]|nr:TlpA disulfide reductase family protein [Zunongwangia atlantica]
MNDFVIDGEINETKFKNVILHTNNTQDTVKIVNGKFRFKGEVFHPMYAEIKLIGDEKYFPIFLESGNLKLKLDSENLEKSVLKNSKSNKEYNKVRALREDDTLNTKLIEYVFNHPDSYVSAYYSYIISSKISLDSTQILYNNFTQRIKECHNGKWLKESLNKRHNTQIGIKIPDFNLIDFKRDSIVYSELKHKKIILFDYWASWCVPCIKSLPHLKKIQEKYADKGLEIIAVSYLDFNRKQWLSAIEKYEIKAFNNVAAQFMNGKIENDFFEKNFYHNGIPFIMLVDKKGEIAGLWNEYSQENEDSMDRVLKELFNE